MLRSGEFEIQAMPALGWVSLAEPYPVQPQGHAHPLEVLDVVIAMGERSANPPPIDRTVPLYHLLATNPKEAAADLVCLFDNLLLGGKHQELVDGYGGEDGVYQCNLSGLHNQVRRQIVIGMPKYRSGNSTMRRPNQAISSDSGSSLCSGVAELLVRLVTRPEASPKAV